MMLLQVYYKRQNHPKLKRVTQNLPTQVSTDLDKQVYAKTSIYFNKSCLLFVHAL